MKNLSENCSSKLKYSQPDYGIYTKNNFLEVS